MNIKLLVASSLVVIACHHPAPGEIGSEVAPPARGTAEVDALWDLAPAKLEFGVVASPHALKEAEAAFAALDKVMASPGAEGLQKLFREVVRELGPVTPRKFEDLGMSYEPGIALFSGSDGSDDIEVAILPVYARDKFVIALGGKTEGDVDHIGRWQCKRLPSGYTCIGRHTTWEQAAKHESKRGKTIAAGARGDVEMMVHNERGDSFFTFQADDGQVTARGFLAAVPKELLVYDRVLAPAPPDLAGATGFLTMDVKPLLAEIEIDEHIGPFDVDKVLHALAGPVSVTTTAGSMETKFRAALVDPAAIKAALALCPLFKDPHLTTSATADGCKVSVVGTNIDAVASVVGNELRIDIGHPATSGPAPTSALAKELANGQWTMAAWGHGSFAAANAIPFSLLFPKQRDLEFGGSWVRAWEFIDEAGIGVRVDPDGMRMKAMVRTAWTGPKELVAQRLEISVTDIVSGTAPAKANAIAKAFPKSRFAADLAAGQAGVVVTSSATTVALVLPFVAREFRRRKPPRLPEAMQQLNKLMKNSKVAYITNASYPVGTVALTPAKSCCGQADNRCHSTPADWADPTWQALDFQIDDPNLFQYSYTSDGKTVDATAVGDLDCDGIFITYKLHLDAPDGNPAGTITEPPPNSD